MNSRIGLLRYLSSENRADLKEQKEPIPFLVRLIHYSHVSNKSRKYMYYCKRTFDLITLTRKDVNQFFGVIR